MSRIVAVKYIRPSASQSTRETEIGNSVPSRRRPTSSAVWPISRRSPVSRNMRRSVSWAGRKRSGVRTVTGRPRSSAEPWPNIRSAAGLKYVTLPDLSMETMPSIDASVTARNELSLRSLPALSTRTPRTLTTITAITIRIEASVVSASPTCSLKRPRSSAAIRTAPSSSGSRIASGTRRRASVDAGSSPRRKATIPRPGGRARSRSRRGRGRPRSAAPRRASSPSRAGTRRRTRNRRASPARPGRAAGRGPPPGGGAAGHDRGSTSASPQTREVDRRQR